MTRFCLACLLALVLGAAPAHAQSEPIALHDGLGGQDRVGRLSWRGGIALRFEDENFGGVSAMEIEPGGRTVTMLTDRGHAAEVFLDYDAGGKLSGAKLVKIRPVLGAASRNIGDERNSDIEAIARIADGGWIVAFERNHRVLQYPRSFEPLRAAPRQLNTPPGILRARGNSGIEAASETEDRKVLLIAEDLPTVRGFTYAWLGNGAEWTPMAYSLFPPYKPVGAALLPDGDIVVIERRFAGESSRGTRIAEIDKRKLRPGAPIQTTEIARLEPPFVTANFEAVTARMAGRGQTLVYLASDNDFAKDRPTLLLMFELLP
jgi:hypothetical protein